MRPAGGPADRRAHVNVNRGFIKRINAKPLMPRMGGWCAGCRARRRSGGQHSTAGQYGCVPLGRHRVYWKIRRYGTRANAVYAVALCLSVSPPVTSRYCLDMNTSWEFPRVPWVPWDFHARINTEEGNSHNIQNDSTDALQGRRSQQA